MTTSTPTQAAQTRYRDIYDHVLATNPGYANAAHSPGYRACLLEMNRIRATRGPTLDVGCGMGFAVELLLGHQFVIDAWGVDVSPVGVKAGNERLGVDRLKVMDGSRVPFADSHFGLVTCFDMLEHLDERDLKGIRNEMRRVLAPGGLLFCSIATRAASGVDQFGDNLHRTVKPADWWAELFDADETRWFRREHDLFLFWKKRA